MNGREYPMTQDRVAAQDRVAPASDHVLTGPVTLMNSFTVRPDRDEAFHELWARTAKYFTAQPGSSPCGCTGPFPPTLSTGG